MSVVEAPVSLEALKVAHNFIKDNLEVNAMQTDAICIRLHGLGGFDYWLDGEEIAEAGGVQAYFSENEVADGSTLYHIFNRDWEVMDTDGGLIDDFCCFRYFGTCDFDAFKKELDSDLDEEVIRAAMSLGIPLDEAEGRYIGHFESETELAYDAVDRQALLEDVPKQVAMYFDYEAYGRDLAMEMSHHDGHYFNP
ncbi:hypothetical protein BZG05_12950 [Salinivibrio kushneri]|uniref:antirestriction protein ArdA n=1 Tax=Salinivibrio kushneri TaxID=1908198 RepID=UPI000989661D|nr:antirestriction protein ArdA [Salinivibrio kushneri]OOE32866.1 hypothetical protein BZG05_12950 [Salinivibrio kushneri]